MNEFGTPRRERLTQLLEQKLELFEQMHALCERQKELLGKDKLEQLDVSLDEAREIREQINGLHQESEPLMQSYSLLPGEQRDKGIEELALKIGALIQACVRLNEENMVVIAQKTEEQSKKIDEHSTKRKGIGGYAPSVPNNPEMFDKKS